MRLLVEIPEGEIIPNENFYYTITFSFAEGLPRDVGALVDGEFFSDTQEFQVLPSTALLDADKLLMQLIYSKVIDAATCGDIKKIIEQSTVVEKAVL